MKTTFLANCLSTCLATIMATATSASFAAAPTAALNHDPATYNNVTKKTAADYKAATAKCTVMTGNARTVCTEEAKTVRARAEVEAVAQYNNTPKGRVRARTAVADADFSLAKAKCGDLAGADKDACLANATSVHTAAVADAKADRALATAADGVNPVTTTVTRDATKAAAIDECAQVAGQPKIGCVIDNRSAASGTATDTGKRSASMVENVADKTRNAAATVVEKTREVAATVADKTRNAAAAVAGKTDGAIDRAADTGATATRKSGAVVADSVITTKVKADIFKEPELQSMAIHVETEKGVVMLSGFVESKADAAKAVRLAKGVEGVSKVKSAILVK